MTALDDSGGEVHCRDLNGELIDELTAGTAAGSREESLVTEFLLELQSQYATPALPRVRTALAEFVEVDLGSRRDLPVTAGSRSLGPAAHPPVLPAWETTATRRIRVPSTIASLLGTLTGKIVLGATVATASVGGAQAAGVINIPTLPSPDNDPGVVQIDDSPVDDNQDAPEAGVDDGDVGDVDDGQVGNVDDGAVADADDGEVGEVGEVDDGPEADVEDGTVGDVQDGPEAEVGDGQVSETGD